jgi:hypothetical protein
MLKLRGPDMHYPVTPPPCALQMQSQDSRVPQAACRARASEGGSGARLPRNVHGRLPIAGTEFKHRTGEFQEAEQPYNMGLSCCKADDFPRDLLYPKQAKALRLAVLGSYSYLHEPLPGTCFAIVVGLHTEGAVVMC